MKEEFPKDVAVTGLFLSSGIDYLEFSVDYGESRKCWL